MEITDREALLAAHISYADKSGTGVDDPTLRDYIDTKIDAAITLRDRAEEKIDELESSQKSKVEKNEISLHTSAMETLIQQITDCCLKEDSTEADALYIEAALRE